MGKGCFARDHRRSTLPAVRDTIFIKHRGACGYRGRGTDTRPGRPCREAHDAAIDMNSIERRRRGHVVTEAEAPMPDRAGHAMRPTMRQAA